MALPVTFDNFCSQTFHDTVTVFSFKEMLTLLVLFKNICRHLQGIVSLCVYPLFYIVKSILPFPLKALSVAVLI